MEQIRKGAPRWHHAYVLLAGLQVVTLVGSLWLNRQLAEDYSKAVVSSQEWSARLGRYADWTAAVAELAATPAQDLGEGANGRIATLRVGFARLEAQLGEEAESLSRRGSLPAAATLRDGVEVARGLTQKMLTGLTADLDSGGALLRVQTDIGSLVSALRRLHEQVRSGQTAMFAEQGAASSRVQSTGVVLSALVGILVASIVGYGFFLFHQAEQAAAAADGANRAKSEFLGRMGHDVRTPLNVTLGMTELALNTDLSDDARQYLTVARSSANRLLDVLTNILDLAKLEAGEIAVESIPFAVRDSIADTLRPCVEQAKAKGLLLSCTLSPAVPDWIVGDPGHLRQILSNLVRNAIQYTARGSVTVRVSSEIEKDEVVVDIAVTDTGRGIRAADKEQIFVPFSQVGSGNGDGGPGVGLAISRELIRLLRGKLWIESQVGEGSTFRFTARFGIDCEGRSHRTPETSFASGLQSRGGEGMNILVAEDDPLSRALVAYVLEKHGNTVTAVENGEQAVLAHTAGRFDVIVMDVQMPGMGGLAASTEIRSLEKRNGGCVPIIALTANAMHGDRERCLAAGMNAYVSKPFQADELLAVVERLTRSGDEALACGGLTGSFDDHSGGSASGATPERILARVAASSDRRARELLQARLSQVGGTSAQEKPV